VTRLKTRLKELRARDGLNQTELAKRTKVSRQTISLIEREELMPSLLIAMKLSRIFDEPIDQIFIFKEEELV
jgi:putative transcriptional regulator